MRTFKGERGLCKVPKEAEEEKESSPKEIDFLPASSNTNFEVEEIFIEKNNSFRTIYLSELCSSFKMSHKRKDLLQFENLN